MGGILSGPRPRTTIHLCSRPGSVCGRAALSLLGFAPGGVCLAASVARGAGALLPHRFTLASVAAGGLFSVALSRGSPGWPLASTPPRGVPTFLSSMQPSRGRPTISPSMRLERHHEILTHASMGTSASPSAASTVDAFRAAAARSAGVEPTTSGSASRRSVQLSYERMGVTDEI